MAVALAACAAGPGTAQDEGAGRHASQPTTPRPAEADAVRGTVSPPPGVEVERVGAMPIETRRGLAGTLDAYVATLDEPAFVSQAVPVDPLQRHAEPSLQAQRSYARARAAIKERRGFDALRELRVAIRAAPHDAAIVKLMAEVQAAGGNTAQAGVLLQKAAALDPDDPDIWLRLGRLALAREAFGEAVWLLARAERTLADAAGRGESSTRPLVDYHLGAALSRLDEAGLALRFYRRYLDADPMPVAASSQARLLALLDGVRWQTLSAVGDLLLRLDRPAEAVAAYREAIDAVADDHPADAALLGRLTYAHLRDGDATAARAVAGELERSGRVREAMAVASYLHGQGVAVDGLVDALAQRYRAEGGSTGYALGLAGLLPRERATALLRDRLAEGVDAGDPAATTAVVDRLLALLVGDGGDRAGVRSVLTLLSGVLPADAAGQRLVVSRLNERVGSPELSAMIDAMSAEGEEVSAAVRLAEGVADARVGAMEAARAAFREAMTDDRTSTVARVELAKLLMLERAWQAAWDVIEPVPTEADEQAGRVRVRLLRLLGRSDEALALLDSMMAGGANEASYYLERAELEASAGRWEAAERTLLEALNADAKAERVYAALFELYDAPGSDLEDSAGGYQRLMRRMLGEIPESRLGRLKRAEWAVARREFGEAERLLTGLLDANPDDLEALSLWLDVLRRSDREAMATALIERRLADRPDVPGLLRLAQTHFGETGQRTKFLEVTRRLLEQMPPSVDRARGLSSIHLRNGELDDAERLIREAMALQDDPEADDPELALTLALILQRKGDLDGAVDLKRGILDTLPEHAPTANDLAYHFAVQGESLDEALELATIAVEAEPDNPAYVDTLGWVYYKLGRFDEAAAELGRSLALAQREARRGMGDLRETRAVVSDHLGDAMYRLGRAEQAREYWQAAGALAPEGGGVFDPDLAGLKDRVAAKLAALAAGEPAPVAGVPGVPIRAIDPPEPEADGGG
jgi:tetratricopeptide (TPR) repeat protein